MAEDPVSAATCFAAVAFACSGKALSADRDDVAAPFPQPAILASESAIPLSGVEKSGMGMNARSSPAIQKMWLWANNDMSPVRPLSQTEPSVPCGQFSLEGNGA